MQGYRSRAISFAVQYAGEPIPDVTCGGSSTDEIIRQAARQLNGCDPSRAHLPHVHTAGVGGIGILSLGCWIMPVRGGPFCVVEDAQFRAHFEVPEPDADPADIIPANDPGAEAAPVEAAAEATDAPSEVVTEAELANVPAKKKAGE